MDSKSPGQAVAARTFVDSVDLKDLKPPHLFAAAEPIDYDAIKNQTMVVGADVVSFVKGVTAESRQDIANSALLAQLVAKKKVPDSTKVYDWYREYFNALTNVGWVIQDEGFTQYSTSSDDADVNSAILSVAGTLLGPGVGALALIKSVLDALKSSSADSPWIELFNRESKHANAAKFQITLADKSADDELRVTLLAFGLEADTTITQVLFFKFHSTRATLKKYSGIVTVDSTVLAAVREQIAEKLSAFTSNYIKQLPDLD
jgi:hypothetical protein